MTEKAIENEIRLTGLSPAARALLASRADEAKRRRAGIPKYADGSPAPLTFVQQMVWLSAQLDKTSAVYNRCAALRIRGPLDHAVLQRAITEIVTRHAILRSRIRIAEDKPELHSFPIDLVHLPVTDLSALAPESRSTRVRELLDEEATRPFDLDTGPLFRAGLFREDENTNTLYISTHHIASDGWSDAVMFRELHLLYGAFAEGEPSPLEDLSRSYTDFAAWQRERAEGAEGLRNAAYWRERLDGAPVSQDLPADHPRTDAPSTEGGEVKLGIELELARELESIGRAEGATPAMTMFAAFLLLQSRLTGQPDTIAGLSLAGRTHADVENLIGLFNCVMPCRVKVDRDRTFRELLRDVRVASLEANDHQNVPVDVILASLPSPGGTRRAEIAETLFNFRNMLVFEPSLPGLGVQVIDTFNGSAVTDLELEVVEENESWHCALRFRRDLFDEATAARLLRHYVTLLESVARDPDAAVGHVQLLGPEERRQILIDFNGQVREFPEPTLLHHMISQQALKTPMAIAVSGEEGDLSYRDLELRSNALARHMCALGVSAGDLIGICMERSHEMIVSLLAILKTGAAFVPLDTDYPRDRLIHMLRDTSPVLLIADSRGAALLGSRGVDVLETTSIDLIALDPEQDPPSEQGDRADVACVLYTSGSTGLPKGVLSRHRGIVNNLRSMQEIYGLSAHDCTLQQTSLGFDAAAWEVFWPLSVGARTYLARPGGQRDADYVIDVIAEQGIAIVGFAPSMLKVMLDKPGFTGNQRIVNVLTYGEVLSRRVEQHFFDRMPHAELRNLYGPSETSIVVTNWKCERGSIRRSVPIGRPMANTEVYILDSALEPVPVGVRGEIYIGGVCVSNGYHNRPELTAERFALHPFRPHSGDRVYRSGDMARFGADGVIEYIGRRDHQLKIRGVRVELEEIESALDRLPGVSESVVVDRPDGDGEHRLIAYVAVGGAIVAPLEMRRILENELPPQFLPSQIIPLEVFPHSPNGKVDRSRLPDPSSFVSSFPRELEAPATEVEQRLAVIWKDLLGQREFGIRDSFFELGGHSLLAVRMLQRFTDETGIAVSLRSFYGEPTIEAVARAVDGAAAHPASDELPPILKVRECAAGLHPVFYLNGQPPGGGKYARRLAGYLPDDAGLYIVPVPIFSAPFTVEKLAARMVKMIRAEQPAGPYALGGNCFGATLAFEIAQQLRQSGEEVSLLALMHPDARTPMHFGFRAMRRATLLAGLDVSFHYRQFSGALDYTARTLREIWREQRRSTARERSERLRQIGTWLGHFTTKHARRPIATLSMLRSRGPREADEVIQDRMRWELGPEAVMNPDGNQNAQAEISAHARHLSDAWTAYQPKPYGGKAAIIWPVEGPANPPWDPRALWKRLAPDHVWRFVPGNHWTMLHAHFEHSARELGELVAHSRVR